MMVKIKSIQLNKIFLFLTILLGCFPILSFGMRSFFTVIWSCLGIYLFFLERKIDKLENFLFFILSLFLISISTIKKKIIVKNKEIEMAKIKNSSPL